MHYMQDIIKKPSEIVVSLCLWMFYCSTIWGEFEFILGFVCLLKMLCIVNEIYMLTAIKESKERVIL